MSNSEAKEFRQKIKKYSLNSYQRIHRWISPQHPGGEIGQLFKGRYIKLIKYSDELKPKYISRFNTSLARITLIVLLVSTLVVFINGGWSLQTLQNFFVIWIDKIESISIISGVIIFLFVQGEERRKQEQYEAWQVVNSAHGQSGSGGRIQALQDLNKAGVDLSGLSAPKADLKGIHLENAQLFRADLSGAWLSVACLNGAKLSEAKLQRADLRDAKLCGADLIFANLTRTNLVGANLTGANLIGAILCETKFYGAILDGAILKGREMKNLSLETTKFREADLTTAKFCGSQMFMADLTKAKLTGADFSNTVLDKAVLAETDLRHVNFEGAILTETDFTEADLTNARNLTIDQLMSAKLCRTKLPSYFTDEDISLLTRNRM